MPALPSKTILTSAILILLSTLYQFIISPILFDVLGYRRSLTTLDNYGVSCEKLDIPELEACEDAWFHEPTGYLYLACSDLESRFQWLPAGNRYNTSGRGLRDRMAVLDTWGTGSLESRFQWMKPEGFTGNQGDGTFNLHGFDVRVDPETDALHFIIINHRPPFDPVTGEALDPEKIGANSTIEHFESKVGSSSLKHVKTYSDETIKTPNRVAWVSEHAFAFTNDHSDKVGYRRELDPFLGGGSIGLCNAATSSCKIAYSTFLRGPNGLKLGPDGLLYVPITFTPEIQVFSVADTTLELVTKIKTPYPLDNMSVDKNGDIIVAGIPQTYKWLANLDDRSIDVPSAVLRVKKRQDKDGNGKEGEDYEVEIMIEDDGTIMAGGTIAVHDVEKKKVYVAGITEPHVLVCSLP
ncbi:serum paraoxonase arylesterase protein [Rutstroemia sp. NJR-2017a WRK4]|nr:serum paraoxonase arylesterase protein [Rutstroemia sp. NJR-2017a WRK4]